jgi:cytochrome c oxidase assembly protein subunit 11
MNATGIHRPKSSASRTRDLLIAASCGAFVATMVGMAYAAVPLYDWFCRTTGFGGTTQVATSAPAHVLDRKVTVRFDANIAPGLPWRMAPERPAIEARLGDVVTMDYIVINESARETSGIASYNVTPLSFGIYFQKINCFCFTEQTMAAGEKREMPVVFYVDPKLAADSENDGLNSITLSYTFYPVREPAAKPLAASEPDKPKGNL